MKIHSGIVQAPVESEAFSESRVRTRRRVLFIWTLVVIIAILWAVPIIALHLASPRTLASAHGFLHTALAQRFGGGSIDMPPENPFFAGRPVTYYWFFHFVAAMLTRTFGLDPLHAFELLIVASMVGLVMTSAALGGALFGRPLVGVLIGYLSLAGTNPLGPIALLARFVRHGTIIFQDNPHHLWGIAHPIFSVARVADPAGLYGPLINFYLNITSRPVALSCLMAVVLSLYWSLRDARPASLVGLSLSTALTTAFSPLIGLAAGMSLVGGMSVSWVWDRLRVCGYEERNSHREGSRAAAGCAIGLGLMLALPTFHHMVGLAGGGVEILAGSTGRLWTVFLSGALLIALACYGTRRCPIEKRRFCVVLLAAAGFLVGANILMRLPVGNESNFFHAAAFLLAVPASMSMVAPAAFGKPKGINISPWRAAVLVVVFLPAPLIVLGSYVGRPPLPLGFEGRALVRLPVESHLSQLYRWARENTATDAIFVIDPRNPVMMGGNVSELPALTERVIFTDSLRSYMVNPYPDAEFRFQMAVSLISGVQLGQFEQDYLKQMNRPIYVVAHDVDRPGRLQHMITQHGTPAFHQGEVAVFRWHPERRQS